MQALLMVQTNRKCIDSNKTLHLEFTTFQCTASAASIHLLSHWDILLWFLLLFRSLMTLLLTEYFFPSRRCWLFSFPKLMLAWYIRMIINYQFHEVECVFLVIWSHTLSNDLKISIHSHGGFQSLEKNGVIVRFVVRFSNQVSPFIGLLQWLALPEENYRFSCRHKMRFVYENNKRIVFSIRNNNTWNVFLLSRTGSVEIGQSVAVTARAMRRIAATQTTRDDSCEICDTSQ